MIKNSIAVFIFTLLLLVYACALKVAPTGGDKDAMPPVAKKFSPENFSSNFNKKEIEIGFNEFIQVKELDKQLIISPIIKPVPQIAVHGKNLVIELKQELPSNTTYTFNFGNAIVDLHEGNPIEDFRYVISTGSFIDTLFIKGKVYYASDLKTEKGVMVMLYKSYENDSTPYKQIPDFFSRTDADGNFSVQNISKGPYRIFALKDADADYKFSSSDENIGFLADPVFANDSTPLEVTLFKEATEKLFIKKSSFVNKAKVGIILNKKADVDIKNIYGLPKWKYTEQNLTGDTISLWLNDTLSDSLDVIVSTESKVIDTLHIIANATSNLKTSKTNAGLVMVLSASQASINPTMPLLLTSSLPLAGIDTAKIILKEDSITIVPYKIIFSDSIKRVLSISAAWKEKKTYTMQLLPGAAQSIYGLANDTTKITFNVNALTDYGSVKTKITLNDSTQYIVQLVTENDIPVYEKIISLSGEYLFENCVPAKYKLRVIKDTDNNKQFTTGKYLLKQQPEKVYYYKEPINVRANWDIEIDWVVKK